MKFSIPFLVAASFTLLMELFARTEPCVRNWNSGPLDLAMAVRIGDMVSSASFIVGAVTIWWVVLVSIVAK